jgi:hypothetical protein
MLALTPPENSDSNICDLQSDGAPLSAGPLLKRHGSGGRATKRTAVSRRSRYGGSLFFSHAAISRAYRPLSSGVELANLWHSAVISPACFVSVSNCFVALVVQASTKSDGPLASATSRAKSNAA